MKTTKKDGCSYSFSNAIRTLVMVRVTGLEPAQPCDHQNLNLTRLPIPPYPHITFFKWRFVSTYAIISSITGNVNDFFEKSFFAFSKKCFAFWKKCDILNRTISYAPVAQWIEHRPPEPGAQVRFLSGVPKSRHVSFCKQRPIYRDFLQRVLSFFDIGFSACTLKTFCYPRWEKRTRHSADRWITGFKVFRNP